MAKEPYYSVNIAANRCVNSGHNIDAIQTGVALGPPSNGVVPLIPVFEVLCRACGLPLNKIRGRIDERKKKGSNANPK